MVQHWASVCICVLFALSSSFSLVSHGHTFRWRRQETNRRCRNCRRAKSENSLAEWIVICWTSECQVCIWKTLEKWFTHEFINRVTFTLHVRTHTECMFMYRAKANSGRRERERERGHVSSRCNSVVRASVPKGQSLKLAIVKCSIFTYTHFVHCPKERVRGQTFRVCSLTGGSSNGKLGCFTRDTRWGSHNFMPLLASLYTWKDTWTKFYFGPSLSLALSLCIKCTHWRVSVACVRTSGCPGCCCMEWDHRLDDGMMRHTRSQARVFSLHSSLLVFALSYWPWPWFRN